MIKARKMSSVTTTAVTVLQSRSRHTHARIISTFIHVWVFGLLEAALRRLIYTFYIILYQKF